MSEEAVSHGLRKALEVWSLQSLTNGAILAGFVVLALLCCRGYLEGYKARLSLRVASEAWEAVTDLAIDGLLFFTALVGLFITNNDIMADIKIALPFVPAGLLLLGVALVLRLAGDGRQVGSRVWAWSVAIVAAGCLLNWFGFTFIMEAASSEYLSAHPSAFWEAMRALRSNQNLELSMTTFIWAAPGYLGLLLCGAVAGLRGSLRWAGTSRSREAASAG